jgi:uncharacterized protein (TIGR03067 family)
VFASSTLRFTSHDQRQAELAQLQGVWYSVAGNRHAELLIAGHHYTVKFLDGALYMGSFDIDPDESPRAMDMRIDEGPVKHKGQFSHCIYELVGDTLHWCPGVPGSDERPHAFPKGDEDAGLCLIFRREVPRWSIG